MVKMIYDLKSYKTDTVGVQTNIKDLRSVVQLYKRTHNNELFEVTGQTKWSQLVQTEPVLFFDSEISSKVSVMVQCSKPASPICITKEVQTETIFNEIDSKHKQINISDINNANIDQILEFNQKNITQSVRQT